MNRIIDVSIQEENGMYFYFPNRHPDWIRLPKQLGGQKKKVIDIYNIDKCKCGKHPTTIYELEGNYFTCKCDKNGYIFVKRK